jgi:hypothetical protein
MPNEQLFSYIIARTSYIQGNDDGGDVCSVQHQHAEFDFYSASSLKLLKGHIWAKGNIAF